MPSTTQADVPIEMVMEVVRGFGVLALVVGVAGVMVRFAGPFRFRNTLPTMMPVDITY